MVHTYTGLLLCYVFTHLRLVKIRPHVRAISSHNIASNPSNSIYSCVKFLQLVLTEIILTAKFSWSTVAPLFFAVLNPGVCPCAVNIL